MGSHLAYAGGNRKCEVDCYEMGFGTAPGRIESSNRKRLDLLDSVYSILLLLELQTQNGFDVAVLPDESECITVRRIPA